ncbi:MAG: ACS family MFS transporter [Thermodesulfobacteriota bacterium]|jgi:ACS family sodium-dependent inorganic phosphate cotransporter
MAQPEAAVAVQARRWPQRLNVVTLMFISVVILYMDRVNISVVAPVLMQEFGWDPAMMGTVLSAFFVGYFLTQVPGGWLADRWGTKGLLGGAVVWWSLVTLLTPFARTLPAMLTVRIALGLGEGLSPPALYSTAARWIPAHERSRVMAFLSTGMYVGLIIAFPVAVWIMTRWGWPWVFYLFGLGGFVWWVAWHLLVTSRPEDHPRISPAELQHILQGQSSAPQARVIPWRRFFQERAFWALICAHFCTNWTWYVFLTWLPVYLVQVRGFSLQEMGVYAMFPYLAMMLIGNGAAWLADSLIRRGISITLIRKGSQTVAFLGAALFLFLLTRSTTPWLTVLCITLGLGALSCFASGMGTNHLDIGPKYAGVLIGITNTAATVPGILAPAITGAIVQWTGDWNMVFYVAIGIMLVGTVVWNLFSTGEKLFD